MTRSVQADIKAIALPKITIYNRGISSNDFKRTKPRTLKQQQITLGGTYVTITGNRRLEKLYLVCCDIQNFV